MKIVDLSINNYMKIYTEKEKNKILSYFEKNGVMKTIREFNVSKTTLRNWRFPDKIKNYRREYYAKNKEEMKADRKLYYENNKEKILEKTKDYCQTKQGRLSHRKWHKNNKDYKKNRLINDPEFREKHNSWRRNTMKNNPSTRIACYLRNRINKSLRSVGVVNKPNSLKVYLGCSIEQLKEHLESQFQEGMTWENQGKWHIDHIKPCASFDLTKESQQKECFHYTNLQPLWAEDNLKKSDTYFDSESNISS